MGAVQQGIRRRLEELAIGETANFPLTGRVTVYREMSDLRIFHDKEFRGRVDKARREFAVKRLR